MKSLTTRVARYLRKRMWALVVAFMLGIHNFYKGDNKTPADTIIKIEYNEVQENDSPED